MDLEDRATGALLGTALGDALGVAAEGMTAAAIARRFGEVQRFHVLGRTGFVSDDTEQSALVAQSIARHPRSPAACERAFRRALLGWLARLPWGIGLATLRACLRIGLGIRASGVRSAGNGSAMRAAIVGVVYRDADERRALGRLLASVTHTDPRAVDGALFVAELAAACASATPGAARDALVDAAREVVAEPTLRAAIERARELARHDATVGDAADALGTTGFVMHTVPFAVFVFVRFGDHARDAMTRAISAGGDTDSIAAVVGAWAGALHGEAGLPAELVAQIHDGPFGPTHLRALARAAAASACDGKPRQVGFSAAAALARNVLLFPIVFFQAVRGLVASKLGP